MMTYSTETAKTHIQEPSLPARKVSSASSIPSSVHHVLSSPGTPLDSATRSFMEPRFGHDFSRVRVHTDAGAARSAQQVGARAYAVGPGIVFGPRQYVPATGAGRRLLAHELAHVIQQENSAGILQPAGVGPVNDGLEAEADRAAESVAAGDTAVVSAQTSPKVQRSPGWSTDTLEIRFIPLNPTTPPQESYTENGFLSQRMSSKLPHYRGPFCQNVTLPFKCDVEFRVDYMDDPRPSPFTSPKVSVLFEFSSGKGGFSISKSDNNPSYGGQDMPLKTSFGTRFDLSLDDNGPFHMKFQMVDPDSGITRTYEDTISVEAKRPCM